jgi:hypothetical protein
MLLYIAILSQARAWLEVQLVSESIQEVLPEHIRPLLQNTVACQGCSYDSGNFKANQVRTDPIQIGSQAIYLQVRNGILGTVKNVPVRMEVEYGYYLDMALVKTQGRFSMNLDYFNF